MPHKPHPICSIPVSACHDLTERLADPSLICPPTQPGFAGTIGPYHILRELGFGGMGIVYLAAPSTAATTPGRISQPDSPGAPLVAIKVLRPELARSPRAVKRFLSEARHMAQFQHPHIMRVLEISSASRRPYFVMPYLPGGSLATRLRHQGIPQPHIALRLALQIAQALALAHSKGIIHRDLNPANVLLDADDNACLSDFGLARTVFNDSIADINREHHEGTLPYMSPAVAGGEAEDTRCDIYGVGALLYELLTGLRPYHDAPSSDVCSRILAGPPAPVASLNPAAPAHLARIAEHAMARELSRRYAHMSDLAADLRRAADGQPPLGPHAIRQPGPNQPPSTRRPAAAILTLSLASVTLLAAGALSLVPTPLATPQSTSSPSPNIAVTPKHQAHPAASPCHSWIVHLNPNSPPELLLAFPSPDGQPGLRLFCFDTKLAVLRWQTLLPHSPTSLQTRDLDADGRPELLIEYAPSNTFVLRADGTPHAPH